MRVRGRRVRGESDENDGEDETETIKERGWRLETICFKRRHARGNDVDGFKPLILQLLKCARIAQVDISAGILRRFRAIAEEDLFVLLVRLYLE